MKREARLTVEQARELQIGSLYLSEMSIPDISRSTGFSRSSIRLRLIDLGVALRSRADAVRLASTQGKIPSKLGIKREPFSRAHRDKISASKLAWGEKYARGTRITSQGYVEFTRGSNKGRCEHIVIMEKQIGRRLNADESVHHKDHNRANNAPGNLVLLTKTQHSQLHAIERLASRKRRSNGQFE